MTQLMKLKVDFLAHLFMQIVIFEEEKIELRQREVLYSQKMILKIGGMFYKVTFTINRLNHFTYILIELEEIVYGIRRTLVFSGDYKKYFENDWNLVGLLMDNRSKQKQLVELVKIKSKNMIDRNFMLVEDIDEFLKFIM